MVPGWHFRTKMSRASHLLQLLWRSESFSGGRGFPPSSEQPLVEVELFMKVNRGANDDGRKWYTPINTLLEGLDCELSGVASSFVSSLTTAWVDGRVAGVETSACE